jgi:hypothetical protein
MRTMPAAIRLRLRAAAPIGLPAPHVATPCRRAAIAALLLAAALLTPGDAHAGSAEMAAAVAAQRAKPSVHAEEESVRQALAEAGVSPATIAELSAAVATADLPGMTAGLDAFLFFTREPRWLALRPVFAEFLTLKGVTSLDAETAAPLNAYGGVISFPDIVDLKASTAAALRGFGGDDWGAGIELPGVRSLTAAAAAELAGCQALLSLPALDELPVESARALAAHEGIGIVLGGLARLPPDAAEAIANTRSMQGLLFPDLSQLDSEPLARRLARQDHVFLPRVSRIEPAILEALQGNDGGELALPHLETVSPAVAKAMVGGGYYWLSLPAAAIEPAAAEILAGHNGQLVLTGTTPPRPATAAALASHRGSIRLPCLARLATDVAEAFAPHEGPLIFESVSRLSPATAEALGRHRGSLILAALAEVSPEVAAGLAGSRELLVLPRVEQLATPAAAALARTPGRLSLPGLRRIPAAGLEKLLARETDRLDLPARETLELLPDSRGLTDDLVAPEP